MNQRINDTLFVTTDGNCIILNEERSSGKWLHIHLAEDEVAALLYAAADGPDGHRPTVSYASDASFDFTSTEMGCLIRVHCLRCHPAPSCGGSNAHCLLLLRDEMDRLIEAIRQLRAEGSASRHLLATAQS